ncbi:hypothetical protein APTSU1_001461100 [Apodemus speciosus]|uniref:Uncharacterized protein n=1 Tax=Apodemus speciosus TaxID=105296 RepID=A0ABQ0FJG3_APOSI
MAAGPNLCTDKGDALSLKKEESPAPAAGGHFTSD